MTHGSPVSPERERELARNEKRVEIARHVAPAERVRLLVSTATEQHPVTGTLSRERVGIETGPRAADDPR